MNGAALVEILYPLKHQRVVACPQHELAFQTIAAGKLAAHFIGCEQECPRLAGDLCRQGVGGLKPLRSEMSADRLGRHDADDLLMVTLAKLVFDLVLPTEDEGGHAMTRVEKDAVLVRQLFEKAIGNFTRLNCPHTGGRFFRAIVSPGRSKTPPRVLLRSFRA